MTPLIDADILRYEIGNSGQYIDDLTGEVVVNDFEKVAELLDQKIKEICALVWATEPPVLYLTNDRRMHKKEAKEHKKAGLEEKEYQPNFRDAIAEKKEYKGNAGRKKEKPFHYDNLTAYMFANYEVKIAYGMEADDLMSVDQYARLGSLDTIICSRDKDLRITPGMHFGWECGKQPQFGPERVTELGALELKGGKKIVGTGLKFFYSQVLTGDTVDNIPGCPGAGPVFAYESLHDATTEAELFERVLGRYTKCYGEALAHKEMLEQCRLLWMVRELNEDGTPKEYVMYNERGVDGNPE